MLPPLTSKTNVTAALCPSQYITDLYAETEASSLHITIKCVMISCAFPGEPSPLTSYAASPSSTKAAEYQRRSHIRGGVAWRQGVTFLSEAYGKSKLTHSLMSYLEMLRRICTSMSQ